MLAGFDWRRAEVDFLDEGHGFHGVYLIRPRCICGGPVEIFGKYLTALMHRHRRQAAHGAERAVDHGLAEIVEQLRDCSSRSMPATILSITSTPRVEPMRQGVHLPQDSMAQNSMAKRACCGHVDGVVEHHDAAMADHGAIGGEGLVVHRQIELAMPAR